MLQYMENKKVVLITGAANGIGKCTALKFAAKNYDLTLVDKDVAGLEHLRLQIQEENGFDVLICAGDLSEIDFLKHVIAVTTQKWNRIDVLVNNAAWRTIETMRTIEIDTWEKTIRTCLTAPAFLAKWSAAIMEDRGIAGVIINISSIMAGRVSGNSPAYVCAKGATESLTYELAVTYGRKGIRVVGVCPGFIDTDMSNDYISDNGINLSKRIKDDLTEQIPLSRGGTPQEVAKMIYWLCSENAAYITGTNLLIDGGLTHNLTDYTTKKLQFPQEF
jgi:NAD(P)-dependent dehydrogenase (short-subunit alcohol dehydrogenase family)